MTLKNHNKPKGKGNIAINKALSKEVMDGKIVQELPVVEFEGEMEPLFTFIPPTNCDNCGKPLALNQYYSRYIISSYGIIEVPTFYSICKNPICRRHHHGSIVGVTGSANYSDEYLEKQWWTRYDGKCSLWNTRSVGEIFTEGLTDDIGRAASPTTLWKYDQKRGKISFQAIQELEAPFDGTIFIDGYWVKDGWRKIIEERLGRELTNREWKRLRYQIIYVAATKDKVVLDFQITNIQPCPIELYPLFSRLKDRFTEKGVQRFVSDGDYAIIDCVKEFFDKATHSFCVFHQLQAITKIYFDAYHSMDFLIETDKEVYNLAQALILAPTVIESTIFRTELETKAKEKLSAPSQKVINTVFGYYSKNRQCLEAGFTPETNNVMEQLFSLIDDFIYQSRSFKTRSGLQNFMANLFHLFNHRAFNTGKWRGYSPIERASAHPT
jgi:hypothetical protein